MGDNDVGKRLAALSMLEVDAGTTEEQANAAVARIGMLDSHMLGLVRFRGSTPWERHPDGDEFLHVLEGDVTVEILHATDRVVERLGAGSVCVVPKGLWHRQTSGPSGVGLLFATVAGTTGASRAKDPRVAP